MGHWKLPFECFALQIFFQWKESSVIAVIIIDLIPLGLIRDVELEDVDIAVIQSGIDEELTTDTLNTGTQCHVFRFPRESSIK